MKKIFAIILFILVLFNTFCIYINAPHAQELSTQLELDNAPTKVLTLTVADNAPLGKKYPLELIVEPKDKDGNTVGKPGEFNRQVIIPKSLSTVVTIPDIPSEAVEVKVILNRGQAFLELIQKRINEQGWNLNILDDPKYKQAWVSIVKLDGTTVTYCDVTPGVTEPGGNAVFAYGLKSAKANNLTAFGISKNDNEQQIPITNVKEVINLENRLGGAKSGNIDFSVPASWNNFSSISI